MVQSAHAAIAFQHEYPDVADEWYKHNFLVFVTVQDEEALYALVLRALKRGIYVSEFREPDLGNSLTAIALRPCDESRRLCKGLPLTLEQ